MWIRLNKTLSRQNPKATQAHQAAPEGVKHPAGLTYPLRREVPW